MKKNLLKLFSSFLFTAFFIIGCQKEAKEPTQSDALANSTANSNANSCRLVFHEWPTVGNWELHYNDKGLADEWIIDLGYGVVTEAMTYDNNGKLTQSNEDFFGVPYVYQFYYTGNRLTRLTRTNTTDPNDAVVFTYTYNSKGQVIRQDDDVHDLHVLLYYDVMGNCTKTALYFGTDLYFTDEYTFILPVRNPRAAIPGLFIGFPFYGTAGLGDKWTFSSNRTTIYDNGEPFLWNDYDPRQTTMISGNHNYPVTADYFDLVTESDIHVTYEYENCNGNGGITKIGNQQHNHTPNFGNANKKLPFHLTLGSAKTIKETIDNLRKEQRK